MRITNLVLLVIFCFSTFTFAAAKFVQPTRAGVGIYKNQSRGVNERVLAQVGVNDRLKVLKTSRNHYQIKTPDGLKGWVEKRLVASAAGKAYSFDDAEVIGYLDNPTPVYIIDADSRDATPIKLDRSFAEALRENVDRETVERHAK